MKKRLLLLWACIACTELNAQTFSNYLQDGNYIFNDTMKVLLADIFTTHKAEFGLGTYDAMVQHSETFFNPDPNPINKGSLQSSYKQYYKGYEIEGTVMNVSSKCGIALYVNGKLRTGLDIDVDDTISEIDALDSAKAYINPYLGFNWENVAYRKGI